MIRSGPTPAATARAAPASGPATPMPNDAATSPTHHPEPLSRSAPAAPASRATSGCPVRTPMTSSG